MSHLIEFLNRVNQAIQLQRNHIDIQGPYPRRQILRILEILYKQRRIRGYQCQKNKISIWLKYPTSSGVLQQIRAISRPSAPVFSGVFDVAQTGRGLDLTLVSTNQGIMIQRLARRKQIGGRILCSIH